MGSYAVGDVRTLVPAKKAIWPRCALYNQYSHSNSFWCQFIRGASCLVLPCSLSMCFFCPFSILITLLGEEGAGYCAYRAFVCELCTRLICVNFSLPPGAGGWLRLLLVALPGLFYISFSRALCPRFSVCFSILITSLREEGAGLCVSRTFVCLFGACMFLPFFSSSWYRMLAAVCDCGIPWTFLLTVLRGEPNASGNTFFFLFFFMSYPYIIFPIYYFSS